MNLTKWKRSVLCTCFKELSNIINLCSLNFISTLLRINEDAWSWFVASKATQHCIEMDKIWKTRYFPKQQGWAISAFVYYLFKIHCICFWNENHQVLLWEMAFVFQKKIKAKKCWSKNIKLWSLTQDGLLSTTKELHECHRISDTEQYIGSIAIVKPSLLHSCLSAWAPWLHFPGELQFAFLESRIWGGLGVHGFTTAVDLSQVVKGPTRDSGHTPDLVFFLEYWHYALEIWGTLCGSPVLIR